MKEDVLNKKIISLILTLCMLSSMSICAFAEEVETPIDPASADVPSNENVITVISPSAEEGLAVEVDSLQAAVNSATNPGDDTTSQESTGFASVDVTKLPDMGGSVIKEETVIDLNGNEIVISAPSVGSVDTETLGLQLLRESDNVVILGEGGEIAFNDTETPNDKLKFGIQNYTNLVLDNVTIDGTKLADYGAPNYVVSNNNGSLTIQNGTNIIAEKGDIAFDIFACVADGYTDAPNVTIAKDAGSIQGSIEFEGTEDCEKVIGDNNPDTLGEHEPSLEIKGGTFNYFLLKIGSAVRDFVNNITISGGDFDSKNVEGTDSEGNAYKFEDFLDDGYVVVEKDGRYLVMIQADADALNAPVVEVIPENAYVEVYVPAAPAPVKTATVVVAEPVAIEVNGVAVEMTVAANEATQLKVVVAPEALIVEGADTTTVIEAIVAAVTVEVKGGDTIEAENFEIAYNENGELTIEPAPEFLKTLGSGKHIIVLKIGGIEIEFTVIIK